MSSIGKLPPQALELEEAVLGALMLEKAPLNDVIDIIHRPEIFYKDAHKKIYESKFLVIADGSESRWTDYLQLGPKNPKFANTLALKLEGLGNIERDSARFDFGSVQLGFTWAFAKIGCLTTDEH